MIESLRCVSGGVVQRQFIVYVHDEGEVCIVWKSWGTTM